MTTKQSEEYFFHQRCEKTSTNFEMAYDYLILTFYWFISAGKNTFYPAKVSIVAAILFYICAFVRMLSVKEGDCGGVSDVKIDYTKLCIKFDV